MKININTDAIVKTINSNMFNMLFFMGHGEAPNTSELLTFGHNMGLGRIESEILSAFFHSVLVSRFCCYIANHSRGDTWSFRYDINLIFNNTGIKLYPLSKKDLNYTMLMFEAKKPSPFSTDEYKELYRRIKKRVDS